MYAAFARVYDALMADVDYAAWAALYLELLEKKGVGKGASVCECACGTGSLTIPLQRLGLRMTGVDLSPEMLQLAGDKARKAGLMIPFVRQDMRRLQLHRPMDAVLATCDGVNYLLTEDDLRGFLTAAREALRPGGALAFDVSTPWKLERLLGDQTLTEDGEDIAYIWHNAWHPRRRQVELRLTIFTREGDGRYSRITEQQTQRAWTREELTDCLTACGFEPPLFTGEKTAAPPKEEEQRWHAVSVRK